MIPRSAKPYQANKRHVLPACWLSAGVPDRYNENNQISFGRLDRVEAPWQHPGTELGQLLWARFRERCELGSGRT
jgi:hypothetical protein